MKKRLKHLSKSTISILLAVLMVVSTFAVGMLTTTAAFVEQNGSVGAKVDSDSVGWNDNDGIHIKIGSADWKTYKADTSTGVTESFTIDSDNTSVEFGFRAWGGWYSKDSSQSNPGYNSTTATYTARSSGSNYSMTLPAGTYRAELVSQSGSELTYRFYRISAGSTTYYIVGDAALGAGGWDFDDTLTETSSGSGVYTYQMTWDASNTDNYNFRIRNVNGWNGGTNYGWSHKNNVTGNDGDVYATLSSGNDNNITVKINKNCIVTLTFTESTGKIDLSFAPDTVAFDTYYVGGRFATATAADNIHSNTTGRNNAVIYGEVLADAAGLYRYSGATATSTEGNTPGYWSWHETSTRVPMTLYSGSTAGSRVYKLETHRTIKQLSEDKDNLLEEFGGVKNDGHDPFYFIIHDQNHKLGSTVSGGINFQTYQGEANPLTLRTYTDISLSLEMRFNDYASQSNGQVVLWLKEDGYNPETGTDGSPKIWYTIENETLPAVTNARISATPNPVQKNGTVTLKGSYTGTKNAENLTYAFFRSTDGKSWTQIREAKPADTYEYTEPSTGGTVYYKVVIGSTDTYDGGSKTYDTRTAQTSVKVYSPGIFMSNHIANTDSVTWSSDLTSPYQTANYPYKRTTGASYTNSNPYEFALSSMSNTWDPNFAKYEIDTASNQFCTIEYGTKDVTIDGEDRTVLTYKVRPNPNCSDPRIYVDFKNQMIWAIATYTASSDSKKSIDNYGSEKVTYYFAEASYCDSKSNSTSGTGMRIHYWNNSNTSLNGNADVTTAVNVSGKNKSGTATNTNSIYVSRGNLFGTGNQDKDLEEFKVYSVELPIWATSFQFTDNNTTAFEAQPTYTADFNTKDHSITLNPNRIYVLYEYGKNYYVKGVVLDESMWNAKRTTDANEVKTKGFDTNIINYTDNNRFQNPDTPNWALNTAYTNRTTPWGLYFGYFSTSNSTVATGQSGVDNDYNNWDKELYSFGKSNAKQWAANLAQRAGNNSYYASVQNLVGMTTSSTKFNANGDGNTFGYLMDTKANNETADVTGSGKSTANNQPLFEYDYIGTVSDTTYNHGNATAIVSQRQKFPFYESTLNGITTYSFDSTTDRNRTFDATNGFQVQNGFEVGRDGAGGSKYVGLFPFGGNDNSYTNCGFGMEFDLTFYMTNTGYLTDKNGNKKDIAFNFSGDDDVWVYVDGVKVLDLGGSHKISAGTINFSDMKVYYKSSANDINNVTGVKDAWASGNNNYINAVDLSELMAAYGKPFDPTDAATRHTFQMFYLERGAMQSNCVISFNLPQASGLNIKNTITADMVNEPLKKEVLHIANTEDYFTYTVDSKLASAAPSGARTPSTASNYAQSIDVNMPVYPYGYKTTRKYDDGTNAVVEYVLSKSETAGSGSATHSFGASNWTRLSDTVYNLSESGYAKLIPADEKYAQVTGKTNTADGVFHLLGSEMATFENKVPTNAYVKVSQTQALGGVNNASPITFKELNGNEVGNYYNTSVSIYDEKAKKYIVAKSLKPLIKSENEFTMTYDTVQPEVNPAAGDDNGFYFSNYSGDNDDHAAMTVEYYNDIAVGTIRIDKELQGNSTSNANFNFTVKLGRLFGSGEDTLKEYPGLEYEVYNSDGTKAYSEVQYYGRGGVVLKAGQYALIKGIPVETRFEIEERPTAGYSFVQYTKTTTKFDGTAVAHTPVITGSETNYDETSTTSQKTSSTIFDHDGVNESADDYFAYYKNMIPPVIETYVNGIKIPDKSSAYYGQYSNMSISKVEFVNKRETFTLTFRYYDRDITNNQPASISSSTTEWSNNFDKLDSYIIKKGVNDTGFTDLPKYAQVANGEFVAYDYEKMINDKLAEFIPQSGVIGVSNLIDDYSVWTTQAKALAGIKAKTNLRTGNTFADDYKSDEEAAKLVYHTTRNGEVNTSGEKWVTYYTTGKKETRDPETHTDTSFFAGDMSNYEQIKEIVVWLYNEPKTYTVNVYGATSKNDLDSKGDITLAGSGVTIEGAYVAKKTSASNYTGVKGYYSQRLGGKKGNEYLDDIAYLKAYGVDSCVNIGTSGNIVRVEPESKAPQTIDDLQFAYWAYDPEGKQVATTDYIYGYRITGDFDLYAVYAPAAMKKDGSEFGLTIVEDANDAYISSGKPMTRINTMFNPYNLDDNDTKIKRVAVVNIYVTKLLQQNYSDEQIKALQATYANQLKSMLAANTFNPLSVNNLNVELTTNGYVYATNAGAQTTATLTNKNRIEFTTQFNNTQLYIDSKTVGIWQIGAMGYDKNDDNLITADEWVLSDNSIVRKFSKS